MTLCRLLLAKVARSRARFFRGDRDLLLYTGRAHFFNRYCIRGIHHLIFYSLPECPQFYPEMVNLLEVSHRDRCTDVDCLNPFLFLCLSFFSRLYAWAIVALFSWLLIQVFGSIAQCQHGLVGAADGGKYRRPMHAYSINHISLHVPIHQRENHVEKLSPCVSK